MALPVNNWFETLRSFDLDVEDYAIFGSGPMIVRGIIEQTNDLDVICRGSVWRKVQELGELHHNDEYNVDLVEMYDGRLTFGTSWGIGSFNVHQLIESAELIDGLPFVSLEHVRSYKRLRNGVKDRHHLRLLDAYLKSQNDG